MTETPPEPNPDSILLTTKRTLGLDPDYTPYDGEIIVHINSVLANLNQLGLGPVGGMVIDGADATWTDFLVREEQTVPDPRLNHAKSYMHMRVKMLFDPPSVGYVLTAYEKMIQEAEWRLMVAQDDIINPLPPPEITNPDDLDEDFLADQHVIVLDGGAP